jgi:hypothetical protein
MKTTEKLNNLPKSSQIITVLLTFCYCNKTPEKNNLKEERCFWLMVSEVSVQSWLIPLLFAQGKAEYCGGGVKLLTSWRPGSWREGEREKREGKKERDKIPL